MLVLVVYECNHTKLSMDTHNDCMPRLLRILAAWLQNIPSSQDADVSRNVRSCLGKQTLYPMENNSDNLSWEAIIIKGREYCVLLHY